MNLWEWAGLCGPFLCYMFCAACLGLGWWSGLHEPLLSLWKEPFSTDVIVVCVTWNSGVKSCSLISKGDFLHPLFNTGNQEVKGRETLSNYTFLPPDVLPP